MAALIANITKSLENDINTLDWMTPATKKRALEKLHAIQNKVGYPEKWIDYSTLQIKPGDVLGNSLRSNAFDYMRRLNEIGKAPDPKEWRMSPPTVNAYYSPLENNINFPGWHSAAAVLRSEAGRRRQLRRHRRSDRSRDHARLRRPGPPLRRRRAI